MQNLTTTDRIQFALCAAGTILLMSWVMHFSHYGIDFTDESYYLVSIANPFIYSTTLTQFGYIYHPLYLIFDGDIAGLRQANVGITFALSLCLINALLQQIPTSGFDGKLMRLNVAAGFATASLIAFDSWLSTTPNYNTLALQSILICAIGIVWDEQSTPPKYFTGSIFIGIGGWLAFMAKPSTALALGATVFLYFLFSKKFPLRQLLASILTATILLLSSALTIDGSVTSFFHRLSLGVEFAKLLGGGHTIGSIFRLDPIELGNRECIALAFLTTASFVATYLTYTRSNFSKNISVSLSTIFLAIVALLALGSIERTLGLGRFQGMIISGVIFSMATLPLMPKARSATNSTSSIRWWLAAFLFVIPFTYVFGTGNNYWSEVTSAAVFWLCGGLLILAPTIRSQRNLTFVAPLALATQAATAMLLQTGLVQPYRQPQPLRLNQAAVEFGAPGSELMLSKGYAKYLSDAKATAQLAGFKAKIPLIDLTGQSPGVLYALQAESIGQAWMIGGYPGSAKLATAALNQVPCEKLAAAWILTEDDGPRSIPTEVLQSQGSAFPADYHEKGAWDTASGAGGYALARRQSLYAPANPTGTLDTCLAIRKMKPE